MLKLWLLLLALCGARLVAATPLQHDLTGWLQANQSAGLVLALVRGPQVETLALGYAQHPQRLAMPKGAQLQLGSIAKTVMALAVLRLVSQGRLQLDAPVEALLPGLPVRNPWAATHPLRLRHLLDMTAGLEDARLWQLFNRELTPDQALEQAWRRDPGVLRLRTPPGETTSYSNLGYTLAGQLIEAVVGERYETWAARELLRPLGLLDSHLRFETQADNPRLAWGHLDDLQTVSPLPSALRPAAQFTSTAADMARLAQFLMGDGSLHGRPFIAPELLRAMGQPVGTAAARAGLRGGYALGLAAQRRHGVVGRCHGGSTVGFRAMFCVYPEQQRAYFWAMNSDREDGAHRQIDARLVRELGVLTQAASDERLPEGYFVPDPGRFPSFAGLELLQADQRLQGELRRLPGEGPARFSDGQRTLRQESAVAVWVRRASLGLMLIGLLTALAQWRSHRIALLTTAGLALAIAGSAMQGWQRLGEFSAASLMLAVASALLPLGWLIQLKLSRSWWQGLPALLVLQGLGLLLAWSLLPLMLWRL